MWIPWCGVGSSSAEPPSKAFPLTNRKQRICSSLPRAKVTLSHPATLISTFDFCKYAITSDRNNNSCSKKVEGRNADGDIGNRLVDTLGEELRH